MTVIPDGPLPRGRHKLSADEVRRSQRARLVEAMIACVGEQGYAATTVPQVIARAQVSRNAFYALFSDKADCFIAVCDELADELLAQMYGFATEPSWLTALDHGMERYLRWWLERPAFSRAYFVELPQAGPRALAQRDAQLQRFADMFAALAARARAENPRLPVLPRLAPRLLTVGITELLALEVRAGRLERIGGLHGELLELAVTLLADEATARR